MRNLVDEILKKKSFCVDIKPEHRLKEDLGLDSLNLVEFIVELEERFNIEIDESDLDPLLLKTVSQIYSLVEKYV